MPSLSRVLVQLCTKTSKMKIIFIADSVEFIGALRLRTRESRIKSREIRRANKKVNPVKCKRTLKDRTG